LAELDELKGRVARACRVLGTLELTKAATGHVSARVPGSDRVLIRARGHAELGVRYTTDDQVIEVDLDGKLIRSQDQDLAVPIEVFIHTAVYRARPEVNSVIHIHPPTVVLFTICDKPLLPLYGAYDPAGLQLVLDGIPTYQRSILISNPELGGDLARVMGPHSTCLMRGHGITTAAGSVEEASLHAIALNELAVMNYRANLLGDPRPISEEDQAVFRKSTVTSASAPDPQGLPTGRAVALWRYYCELTGA
jgi:ribulose-5-phosphate 4-epimerase/fuculose-1-phosphate aldolase